MKKQLLLLFLALLPLFASAYKIDGIYYNFEGDEASVISYSYSGSVSIPSEVSYNGKIYSVTSIGVEAFDGCSSLTSITIPNSVKSIGERAFYNCSSLTSITIPNSVKSIGDDAFWGCYFWITRFINNSSLMDNGNWGATLCDEETDDGLLIKNASIAKCRSWATSVAIPNSVTSIGNYAFRDCSGLTSITIPNSVTSIGASAFQYCSGLTSITIGNSVTSIGNYAFRGCSGLTSIDIPNSVTSIGDWAFYNCSGLTSIDIPNSVTSIGDGVFDGCKGLTSITIGNSVTSIGDWAFNGCSGLTSIDIPNSVTSIGKWAFYGCSGLTSITIPNSVTSIGYEAFRDCSGLTSITIPNSVTSIGESAFSGCYFLPDCFINNSALMDNGNWGATLCDEETDDGLLIKNASIAKCRSWATSVTIPNSITSINSGAFSECKLHDIFVRCNIPPQLGADSFTEQTYAHGILYVPTDCWDAYAYDRIWYKFINIRETATAKNQVSSQKAYTLMNVKRFTYSVYDPVNDCIDTNRPVNGINEDNPNHCWQIIEWGDEHYLYNIGAKKFAKRVGNGIALTDSPAPIEIADGESGIVLGGKAAEQWALVHNENMNVNQSPITAIAPTTREESPDIHYYDLCGRQTKDARKGINIIGRKKILIK